MGASIGLSTRTYQLVVPSNGTLDRKYSGGLFPEFTLALQAFPLVLATNNFARNIGLGISYTRHLSISTKLDQGAAANPGAVDTSSQEILFDARLRWAIKDDLAGPVVYGYFGFGLRSFSLGPNVVLTSMGYQFLNFGVGGRIPLGSPLVSLRAEVNLRPLLQVGQEAVDAFGERDGGFAWSFQAGLYGRLKNGLFYFATFQLLNFSMKFTGLDAVSTAVRPNTADLGPASEGTDRFIRIWAGAGYAM